MWELTLTRPEGALSTDLKTRAERTAARVTGLLEPLRLIEVDAGRDAALLRSTAPQKRGDDLYYYEVELKTGGGAASAATRARPPAWRGSRSPSRSRTRRWPSGGRFDGGRLKQPGWNHKRRRGGRIHPPCRRCVQRAWRAVRRGAGKCLTRSRIRQNAGCDARILANAATG